METVLEPQSGVEGSAGIGRQVQRPDERHGVEDPEADGKGAQNRPPVEYERLRIRGRQGHLGLPGAAEVADAQTDPKALADRKDGVGAKVITAVKRLIPALETIIPVFGEELVELEQSAGARVHVAGREPAEPAVNPEVELDAVPGRGRSRTGDKRHDEGSDRE